MNTRIKLIFILLAFSVFTFAQKKELETITENDLKAHLEFVASDYLQGRDFYTEVPGLDITADYLKAQCKKMGMKPGFEDYFQPVEMISVKPDLEQTILHLTDSVGEEIYETQEFFSLGGPSKNDTISGNIVFAGYGWYNDETSYNDTKDIDLKGKIVLVMTRNLEQVKEGADSDIDIEMKKMAKALMGGAKALVMVTDPQHPNPEFIESVRKYATGGNMQLKNAKGKQVIPIRLIFGTEELANKMLAETGKNLADLQNEISKSGSPKSFQLHNAKAEIQLIKSTETVMGKNVVAVIEGSDPVLKNECVLFTAHYDHLGTDNDEGIYNGADDNGTGTVALLEIAEAFQSAAKKPKRSIVFAWVTAEEKGLIGSDYYSQNPVFPLENTLVDINLDMVGRSAEKEPEKGDEMSKQLAGPNGLYIVSGKQSTGLMEISNTICAELGLIPSDELTKAFLSRSDYFHFYKNGVPILGLSTGMHDDYHKTTDELEKIDYTKMKRIAHYSFLVAHKLANQKKRLVVDKSVRR